MFCANCKIKLESGKRCAECQTVDYCNKACQQAHWGIHKPQCRPFMFSIMEKLLPDYRQISRAVRLWKSSQIRGVKFTFDALAFYRSPPLRVSITMGFQRQGSPVNHTKRRGGLPAHDYFLFIETKNKDFTSPANLDDCFYNSLEDTVLIPDMHVDMPLLLQYTRVLTRYKIFIPFEIYQIFQDDQYCDYYSQDNYGWWGTVHPDFSRIAYEKLGECFDAYYIQFGMLVTEGEACNPFNYFSKPPQDELPVSTRNRLMLGEANFSYSAAFCKAHSHNTSLHKKIIATEYLPKEQLEKTYNPSFTENYAYLKSLDVEIYDGVDATKIHQQLSTIKNYEYLKSLGIDLHDEIDVIRIDKHPSIKNYKFKYIHFNCPHDGSSYNDGTLPKMLATFFRSASQLQDIGHCIYMALPIGSDLEKKAHRLGIIYKVYDAAAAAGYRLVKKRPFGAVRYPGYVHQITGRNKSASVAENTYEYIFRKIEPTDFRLPEMIHYKSPPIEREFGAGKPHQVTGRVLPDNIETDYDSSDYDSSGEEDPLYKLKRRQEKVLIQLHYLKQKVSSFTGKPFDQSPTQQNFSKSPPSASASAILNPRYSSPLTQPSFAPIVSKPQLAQNQCAQCLNIKRPRHCLSCLEQGQQRLACSNSLEKYCCDHA